MIISSQANLTGQEIMRVVTDRVVRCVQWLELGGFTPLNFSQKRSVADLTGDTSNQLACEAEMEPDTEHFNGFRLKFNVNFATPFSKILGNCKIGNLASFSNLSRVAFS